MQELTYQLEDDQRQYETALNDRDAQLRKMRGEVQALVAELQVERERGCMCTNLFNSNKSICISAMFVCTESGADLGF